jgi:cell shape-determining protein MreD
MKVLAHLILLPLYSGIDLAAQKFARGAINYVRVPAGLSLLMLLVFWSTIRGKGAGTYARVSGLQWDGHATRWLLITAALFALSGALYLLRRRTT